jgi:ssDNA-binding replication factor A large subunit
MTNELKKRVVVLVDQSLAEIGLTLWGSVAEKFDPEEEHPVLAVKGAKVTDYNGLSLSAMGSSVIQVLFQFFNFFTQRVSTYSTIWEIRLFG